MYTIKVELELTDHWAKTFIGLFVGAMIVPIDEETLSLAKSNYRKLYKAMPVTLRREVKDEIRAMKADPRGAFNDIIEAFKEVTNDDDVIDKVKKYGE